MKSRFANCEMKNQIFQSSAKFTQSKIKKKNLIHLHRNLVETISLIFHSKVVFKKLFWLKLFILKNTLHTLSPW